MNNFGCDTINIENNWLGRLWYLSYLLVPITLPLNVTWNGVAIGLWVLLTSMVYFRKGKETTNKLNALHIVFLAYYVVHVIGYFFSDNSDLARLQLEVKASLFIIPLLLCAPPPLGKVKAAIELLIFMSLAVSFFYFFRSIYQFFINDNRVAFDYLVYSKGLAPSNYLTLFLNLGIVYIIISLFKNEKFGLFGKKIAIVLVCFSLVHLFLLGTRIAIIFQIIFFSYVIYKFMRRRKIGLLKIGIIYTILLTATLGIIIATPKLKNRFYHPIHGLMMDRNRYLMWSDAMDVLLTDSNWLFGLGTGDGKGALLEKYQENKHFWLYDYGYNVHNEFLDTSLRLGIPGLFLLLCMFVLSVREGMQSGNTWLIGLSTLVIFSCLIESVLSRQQGVVLFVFYTFCFRGLSLNNRAR